MDQAYGNVPPVAASVWLYEVQVVPDGNVVVVILSGLSTAIVYTALFMVSGLPAESSAKKLSVVDVAMAMGAVYIDDDVVGVEPSVVK